MGKAVRYLGKNKDFALGFLVSVGFVSLVYPRPHAFTIVFTTQEQMDCLLLTTLVCTDSKRKSMALLSLEYQCCHGDTYSAAK